MSSPPTSAPPVESRPPRMAAGKARSAVAYTAELTPGVGLPTRNKAATPARTPATTQASAETRPCRIPMRAAVSPSSAEARMATPQLEYLKATKNTTMNTPATNMAMSRFWVIPMPPMRTDSPPHGCGTLRMSGPIRRISSVSRMMSTPMVTIARLITGAPRRRLIINRLRGAPVISLAIVTIGVDIILLTELIRRIGPDILNVPHPWGGESVRIGGIGITQNRLIAMIVAGVLIALFFVAFKYSSWGVAMRASAEDGETAALMGIRQGRVSALAWVVAGVLAGVAALFLVGSPTPGVSSAVYATALRAVPVGTGPQPGLRGQVGPDRRAAGFPAGLPAVLRRVLAAHRVRGVRRGHRRHRPEPARGHDRPAVPGARVLPRRRGGELLVHL